LTCFAFISFFCTIWFLTSNYGISLQPDSASYLSTAQNLQSHGSLRDYDGEASAHYPPGYSAMLVATSATTFRDIRHGAPRLLASTLFGLLGVFSILILQRLNLPIAIQIITLAAMISFRPLLYHASVASSELPFLATLAGTIYFFISWIDRKQTVFLFISSFLCALMCLTRYVGIVWPVAFCITAFIFSKDNNLLKRVSAPFIFAIVSYLPLSCWLFAWSVLADGHSARKIAWHPVSLEQLSSGGRELLSSVSMSSSILTLLFICAIVMIGLIISKVTLFQNDNSDSRHSSLILLFLLALSTFGYCLFLVLSISFFDRATPLDGRILLPASWSCIMILTLVIGLLDRKVAVYRIAYTVLLLCFFWTRFLFDGVPLLADIHTNGIELSRPEFLYNQTLRFVREDVSSEKQIYSNTPWTIYLVTKHNVSFMPSKTDYTSGLVNNNYEAILRDIVDKVKKEDAILVLDALYRDGVYDPPTTDEVEELGLVPNQKLSTERFRIYGH
jgi:hypothetical protein